MARKSTKKRTPKRRKADSQLHNQEIQNLLQPAVGKGPNTYQMMTKMSGVKSNPVGEMYAFNLKQMLAHIRNNATTAKAKAYASVKNIPEQARTSLALFYVDWGGNDINHEQYLKNMPEGYSASEALKMGELLYWCISGNKAAPSVKLTSSRTTSTEWRQLIEKTDGSGKPLKKGKKLNLPTGVSIHDLTGLHIELLNMLPQSTYTHYTLNQLFGENREMYDALFQDFVALNPMEHDTLQVMQRIVEQGNIERFRLAMMHGTQGKVRKMLSDGTFGANLLDAFSEAKEAVSSYKRGDYAQARMGLEKLQLEYGLAPDLFQLGLAEMFVIHAATPIAKGKKYALKGPNTQLLVSVDKSVGPAGGWPGAAAIRDRMSAPARKIDSSGKIGNAEPEQGTSGSRLFSNTKGAVISTDWVYFFAALNSKNAPSSAGINPTKSDKSSNPGINEENRTVRLLIHARMDKGFEDLVPKGTLLVTIRPGTTQQAQRSTSRRQSRRSRGGGGGRGRGGSGSGSGSGGGGGSGSGSGSGGSNGLISLQDGANQPIGLVDLIFEDFGGLFDKKETKGGTFQSTEKKPEATIEETGRASEEQLTAGIAEMQPEETSDMAGLLGRRSAKRMTLGVDYHDHIDAVKRILKKEGGAAGLTPLKAAFPKGTNKAQAQRLLEQMPGVVLHADGDYILVDTLANPAKGGGRSMGQTIVIELTPKADLTIHKSREDAKWLKMVAKTDPEIKALYDKFAKTSTGSKAQEGRVKKGKKKGEGITGGSYVLYKGNQTALKMIKAPRKDNNEMVPWLLMIPHILVAQGDNGSLVGKKGSGAEKGIKNLLGQVEKYYGAPKFKTNLGMGGFRLISERTARKMKQSGSAGKKIVDLAVHEGVKKIFTTPGVEVELEGKTVMARADRYKLSGDIMYRARMPSSKKIIHFQQSGGAN